MPAAYATKGHLWRQLPFEARLAGASGWSDGSALLRRFPLVATEGERQETP